MPQRGPVASMLGARFQGKLGRLWQRPVTASQVHNASIHLHRMRDLGKGVTNDLVRQRAPVQVTSLPPEDSRVYHQTALAGIRVATVPQIEPRHCDLPPSRSSRNGKQTRIRPFLRQTDQSASVGALPAPNCPKKACWATGWQHEEFRDVAVALKSLGN